MAFKISYDGSLISVFPKELNWTDKIGATPTAEMTIKAEAGGTIPQRGKEILIYDDEEEETINKTVPGTTPPGLIYLTDHTGTMMVQLPFQSHPNGSVEGVFATLYNLPDISEYVSYDVYITGAYMMNGPWNQWVNIGVVWKDTTKDYRYFVRFYTHIGSTFYEKVLTSTTALELDVSHRLSITWETAGDGNSCEVKLYLDGELEDSDTAIGTMAGYYTEDPNECHLQGDYDFFGIGYYFSDFRIFLDVRTAEEIDTWKSERLSGDQLTDPDLEAYWMIDEMTGVSLTDSSPNENTATLLPGDYDDYLLWGNSPDAWLPGGEPSCEPSSVGLRYFGGLVESVRIESEGPGLLTFKLKIEGYASLLNRYLVDINFTNPHPGKYYAQYIAQRVLDAWGIGWACIPSGSQTILVSDWKNKSGRVAMDEVAESTNWIWYIDPYKELRYHPRGYKSAPFNITASDSPAYHMAESLKVREDKDGYYNRLVARMKYKDERSIEHIVLITVQDSTEIALRASLEGGDGIYEVYQDLPEAITPEHALDQAYGLLSASKNLGTLISYTTQTPGLRAGMVQTITLPDWGLSGDYVVEEVRANYIAGYLFYDVQLSSWTKPKLEPLSRVLSSNIASKTNWRDTILYDGAGTVHDIETDLFIYEDFTITDGTAGGVWDSDDWNITEWS